MSTPKYPVTVTWIDNPDDYRRLIVSEGTATCWLEFMFLYIHATGRTASVAGATVGCKDADGKDVAPPIQKYKDEP